MSVDVARLGIEVDSRSVRTANRDLDALDRRGQRVEDRFTSFGRSAQRLSRQLTMWVTTPILGASAAAVKAAADYETLQVQLEVLTGSAEAGAEAFEKLTQFSARTPFQLTDLVRANNTLIGFGLSAEQAFQHLQTLGDVAAVTGGDLQAITVAFGQAAAEGVLLTRDIRQLINQGVPAIKLLADSMGVATDEVKDLATEGEITFDVLVQAMEEATQAGGMFENGTERLADTLSGIWSTLKDNVSLALGAIGDSISENLDIKGTARALIANIQDVTKWFTNLEASSQRMIITMSMVVAAIGPVIGILATLSLAIGAISAPVAAVVTAIAIGTAAIIDHWEEVEAYFTTGGGAQMWEDLKGIVHNSAGIITDIWETAGDDLMQMTENAFGFMLETIEFSLGRINEIMSKFNGEFDDELNIFEDNILTTLSKIDSKIISFTTSFAGFLYEMFISDPLEAMGILETRAERMQKRLEKARRNATPRGEDVIFSADINTDLGRSKGDIEDMLQAYEKLQSFWDMSFKPFVPNQDPTHDLVLPDGTVIPQDSPELLSRIWDQFAKIHGIAERGGEDIDWGEPLDENIKRTKRLQRAARDLGFSFSSAAEEAIMSWNGFGDLLKGIFRDIQRIMVRTQVTGPLSEGLTDLFSGINLFGSGESVDDALIRSDGSITRINPNDDALLMQDLSRAFNVRGESTPAKSETNVNVNIINETDSQVEVQQRQTSRGVEIDAVIKNAVKDGINKGQFDSTFNRNFGMSRRGRG